MTTTVAESAVTPARAGTAPDVLRVALPKGRMADDALGLMLAAGLPAPLADAGRKLVVPSADGRYQYILAKPSDVPTYVEYGAADIGVCGLDTLRESGRAVYEPLLLPFGRCRLSVCAPVDRADIPLRYESQPRVATKYPKLTMEFFRKRGVNAEVIALNGSVELGPLVVAFTDGLRHAGSWHGAANFDPVAAVRQMLAEGISDPREIADCLLQQAVDLDGGRPRDDISVVVVAVTANTGQDEVRRLSGRMVL